MIYCNGRIEMENRQHGQKELTLNEAYDLIMRESKIKDISVNLAWEKEGDLFKKFSIFDYSKYSTATKASID